MAAYNEKKLEKPSESRSESIQSEKAATRRHSIKVDPATENINAKLANPLAGIPQDQLMRDGALFAREHNLPDLETEFSKGALVAQDPFAFETLDVLAEDDKAVLRRERTHRWDQPKTLYW